MDKTIACYTCKESKKEPIVRHRRMFGKDKYYRRCSIKKETVHITEVCNRHKFRVETLD